MSIIFYAKTGTGGHGDRLCGLITVYFMSKAMNKKFYINWESPDIKNVIEINPVPEIINCHFLHFIDGRAIEQRESFEKDNLNEKYPFENINICCNQNLVINLYNNPHYSDIFKKELYESDIKNAYDKIYTEFLIPKDNLNNIISSITDEFNKYDKIIGIHIRTGDFNMGVNLKYKVHDENSLDNLVMKITKYIKENYLNNYALFVTSDFPNINLIFEKYLEGIKVFYHNYEIIHIDMIKENDNVDDGIIKLFADHITLSKCNETITHRITNFGKSAGLISNGNKLGINYDGNFISPVTISQLAIK